MATAQAYNDGWEGTWIPPPKTWTRAEFKPMTAQHKAEWVSLITSPAWADMMEDAIKEDAEIEKEYASHKFDIKLMEKIREGVFHSHELDHCRSFRALDIYSKKQRTLLSAYLANKTLDNYRALMKDITARGQLVTSAPKKMGDDCE